MDIIDDEEIKKEIIRVLNTHPEGLTIIEIAKVIGVHRQTAAKYILWLDGAGEIYRRRIGAVTLNYLKRDWEKLGK